MSARAIAILYFCPPDSLLPLRPHSLSNPGCRLFFFSDYISTKILF